MNLPASVLMLLVFATFKVDAKLRGARKLQSEAPCGCSGCSTVWNTLAGGHSCGARIDWLKTTQGLDENNACIKIGESEFPSECGACNPNSCIQNAPTLSPTAAQTSPPTPSLNNAPCGCSECRTTWNLLAGEYSCGDRIEWLKRTQGLDENDACIIVGESEYPSQCGGCNPNACDQNSSTLTPSASPTSQPSPSPTSQPSPAPTSQPSPTPTNQPTPLPTNASMVNTFCNCNTCTEDVWNSDADGFTCGNRIAWLRDTMGRTEEQACSSVAGEEFPIKCRGCDPNTCEGGGNTPNPPSSVKCGAAVDSSGSSNTMCQNALWTPTNDPSMHCFAYGGPGDPCHLSNNNDPNDGLDKDPSKCSGDTLYLWDEPDTQGRSYTWAGRAWNDYANRFANELRLMRQAGTKVTTPLIRAGESEFIKTNVDAFFDSCGASCRDPNSPAYIDIIAVNAFCGPWNGAPLYCRGGADFITAEVQKVTAVYNLPAYITNWSKLRTSSTDDQVDAIEAIDGFFVSGSPIERVYWFGATDYGGGSANNFLTNTIADGRSLGQLWKAKCDALN